MWLNPPWILLPSPGPQPMEVPHLLSFPKVIPEEPGVMFCSPLMRIKSY